MSDIIITTIRTSEDVRALEGKHILATDVHGSTCAGIVEPAATAAERHPPYSHVVPDFIIRDLRNPKAWDWLAIGDIVAVAR